MFAISRLTGRKVIIGIMDAQIVIAVAATGISGVAVVVTLCLALLRGFRWLYGKIDSTAKELREDNAALAKELYGKIDSTAKELREDNAALAKELNGKIDSTAKEFRGATARNTAAIARVEGRMTVMEAVLKSILQAVLPGSGNSVSSSPADADESQAAAGEPLVGRVR